MFSEPARSTALVSTVAAAKSTADADLAIVFISHNPAQQPAMARNGRLVFDPNQANGLRGGLNGLSMSKGSQQRLGRASNRPFVNCADLVAVQNFMTCLDDR